MLQQLRKKQNKAFLPRFHAGNRGSNPLGGSFNIISTPKIVPKLCPTYRKLLEAVGCLVISISVRLCHFLEFDAIDGDNRAAPIGFEEHINKFFRSHFREALTDNIFL